ncbi:MAG: hypothetical protein H6Q74_2434 [Firmicutes bacterium]|nr:hypothetical protein [Bacillota bacterium]
MIRNQSSKNGYGPNNPEPKEFKESATVFKKNAAFEASDAYINGTASEKNKSKDNASHST